MESVYLTVIVPTSNEAYKLPLTLIDIDRHLAPSDFSYEVLAVGKPDEVVRKIIDGFSSFMKGLKLVEAGENCGRALLKKGLQEARGEYRVIFPPDNSVSASQLPVVLQQFKAGFGVVLGTTRGKSTTLPVGTLRRSAVQSFRAAAAREIVGQTKLGDDSFLLEVLAIAKKEGIRVGGVDIEALVADRPSGLQSEIRNLLSVLKIKVWLVFGAYKR
ncbi:MAG: glycosyltransferase [Patescibacteria group bacterium]|nr:glycosyltransferase [Patescibacteria group bacterium]